MKILVDGVIYSLKKGGGIRRYFDGYLPLLKKVDRDINVDLFLHSGLKGRPKVNQKIRINRMYKLPVSLPKTLFAPIIEPLNKLIVSKFWSKVKGDIFHSTYYTRHPNPNIPQVVTVYDMIHELFPQYFAGKKHDKFRALKKQIIEKAEAIICISENTKKDLLQYYKIDKKKLSVIYPGVDRSLFRPIGNQRQKNRFIRKYKIKKPYLLYIGPRGRYKNFLKLVEAYASWSRCRDFSLVAVGGSKFTKKEKIIFKKNNLINQVKNFAFVEDSDLVLFYNCALAYINPSVYEGFGIPLLEAMICGVPVLASNISVFKEVGKENFIYFNPKSIKSIVKALNGSLDKNLRLDCIKKGLIRAKQFNWKKTAEQTIKVYKRLITIKQSSEG